MKCHQLNSDSPDVGKTMSLERSSEITAIMQGCQKESLTHEFFCTLVANGCKYLTYGDASTPDDVMQELAAVEPGRRVRVSGRSEVVYDTTHELLLDRIEVLARNDLDDLLAQLQGTWASNIFPNDEFTIIAAERYNTYAGAQTSLEYVSVQNECLGETDNGPYLLAWDSKGGTRICYRIQALNTSELVLRYLPSGSEYTFTRTLQ